MEKTVLELLRESAIEPRRVGSKSGGEYHSPCPGCGGNDRFRVWVDDNDGNGAYDCRDVKGCGKRGDNIQFCRDFMGMDFRQAAAYVGRRLDPQAPPPRRPLTPPSSKKKPGHQWTPTAYELPPQQYRDKAGSFARWAHEQLLQNKPQLDWLAARGIGIESVKTFCLGWNPGKNGDNKADLYRSRQSWGLDPLIKNGKPKRLWMPTGLVIPHIRGGEVIRLQIRRSKESRQKFEEALKYYFIEGGCAAPMILGQNCKARVVVEAALDGIATFDACSGQIGSLILWSASTRPDTVAHEILQRDLDILDALDYEVNTDTRKSSTWWSDHYQQSRRWPVPVGKDPGEAFAAGVDLRRWVYEGLSPRMQLALSGGVITKPEDRGQCLNPGLQKEEGRQEGCKEGVAAEVVLLADYMRKYGVTLEKIGGDVYLDNLRAAPEDVRGVLSGLVFGHGQVGSCIDRCADGEITAASLLKNAEAEKAA